MTQEFANYDVCGIPISAVTPEIASEALIRWAKDDIGRYVGVREMASVMAMYDDPYYLDVARNAAMNVPDGMPLVLIGKKRGYQVERTCGPDLIEKIMLEHDQNKLKHFFYGGKEGVADKLAEVFRERAPGVQIVGTYCPPFRPLTPEEDREVIDMIEKSGADIVWVGISSPKQDVWMYEHVNVLPVTMLGVGAAFDFHSGEVRRAPIWMRKSGLEFLHRLISEPKRLWRRYLILGPKFLFKVATEKPRK